MTAEKQFVVSRPSDIRQPDVGGLAFAPPCLFSGLEPQPICSALRCRSEIPARLTTVIQRAWPHRRAFSISCANGRPGRRSIHAVTSEFIPSNRSDRFREIRTTTPKIVRNLARIFLRPPGSARILRASGGHSKHAGSWKRALPGTASAVRFLVAAGPRQGSRGH